MSARFVYLFVILSSAMLAVQSNPVPLINRPLVLDAVAPGGQGFTLTVNGSGFVSGSVVNWNGNPRATIVTNASQLMAAILASDIVGPGTAYVSVSIRRLVVEHPMSCPFKSQLLQLRYRLETASFLRQRIRSHWSWPISTKMADWTSLRLIKSRTQSRS